MAQKIPSSNPSPHPKEKKEPRSVKKADPNSTNDSVKKADPNSTNDIATAVHHVKPAEVESYLIGATYPTSAPELVEVAKRHEAPQIVIEVLEGLKEVYFNDFSGLSKAIHRGFVAHNPSPSVERVSTDNSDPEIAGEARPLSSLEITTGKTPQ